ncbi:MAG: NAD(+)/NADH kinase [Actinobacteria bacterium]|nr:NAD(+)/NADH kinase [Actinomycetota bacterium]
MGTIGVVLHPARKLAGDLAQLTIDWAAAHGHTVRIDDAEARGFGLAGTHVDDGVFAEGLDVAVCFGGDGTMLRTVSRVGSRGVPILGVNVGQLGYLSAAEPDELTSALERFFAGDYLVEERMLVSGRVDRRGNESNASVGAEALNEIVLERTSAGHTVRIAVLLNGEFFTTYAADGLIVATPTGSTAYSFSARGPIVAPSHRALIVTPVSPHMLFDRALVLGPETVVRLELTGSTPATIRADGRTIADLEPGDTVECTASTHPARLVRFDGSDFARVLKSKFGLNDR